MKLLPYISILLSLLAAPLLTGIINKTKALFAGRNGPPLLQPYFDLSKLLRKDAVYSRTTTWIFRAAPSIILAATATGFLVMPSGAAAPLPFSGDVIFFIYCLALARLFTVLAALDTGSSFEGMGASREVLFSALAEPVIIISVASLARITGSASFTSAFGSISQPVWLVSGISLALISLAFVAVILVENSRIPFDDPNTHLELTMIHEVMILDYSGPDLGIILYAASLKLWILGAFVINTFIPLTGLSGIAALFTFFAGMMLLAVLTGIIESITARLKMPKVPQILVGAGALAFLAFALLLRLK